MIQQDLDFPGGKIPLTSEMKFISEASDIRLPCYRVLNDDGSLISDSIYEQVLNYLITTKTSSLLYDRLNY